MMKTYSHIRRKALDGAACVLEAPDIATWKKPSEDTTSDESAVTVTSQSASRSDNLEAEVAEILRKIGSSGWIRTSNPRVNSLSGYSILLVLQWFSRVLIPAVTRCSGANCSLIVHSDRDVLRQHPSGGSR